ncbi:MAG: SpoIID/LytB domain-containing protein [Longimonas sp.]|uniref:SpoIID/LytB domain-containing protein n=1 Tax=Longimonas sp. TaxID=2039626 RepID=UPI003974CED9
MAFWSAFSQVPCYPLRGFGCGLGGIILLLLIAGSRPAPAAAQDVRVRIFDRESPRQIELTASRRTPVHTDLERAPLFHIEPGTSATLTLHRGDVRLEHGSHSVAASTLYLDAPEEAATTFQSQETQRSYSGVFEVRPDGNAIELVNAVPLEHYVASVVASEYGLDDEEGAKAMAVVVRTYALRGSDKFDSTYTHVDHTISQVYRGLSTMTDASRAATEATRGEVLTYQSHLIEAVYFSSSGGHTANNEDVWDASETLPYLRGRNDPYDSASPHHTWESSANRTTVLSGLERQFGGSVRGFYLGDTADSGRLLTMELLRPNGSREPVQANAFRQAVNRAAGREVLKSTWFEARRSGSRYVFAGRGYGHGVGLSQWGAHGMANEGRSYRDILGFYYQGATITHLDNVEQPPAQLALDEPGAEEPDPAATESRSSRRIGW